MRLVDSRRYPDTRSAHAYVVYPCSASHSVGSQTTYRRTGSGPACHGGTVAHRGRRQIGQMVTYARSGVGSAGRMSWGHTNYRC